MYFYLRIVVAMFMKESNEKTGLALSPGIVVALALALIFTLWIGFCPDPFIHLTREAVFLAETEIQFPGFETGFVSH
jgi:NADH:ubiquinone oxidoreductase subunit 2 (subunit N)